MGGQAFYGLVTRKKIPRDISFSKVHVHELADIFYPAEEGQEREYLTCLLRKAGYPDRYSILIANPDEFRLRKFGDRKGVAFYGFATGSPLGSGAHLTKVHLRNIADIAYPSSPSQDTEMFRSVAVEAGYSNRRSIIDENPNTFEEKDFRGIKGKAFYKLVMGESLGDGGLPNQRAFRAPRKSSISDHSRGAVGALANAS